jgi:hypothetical protein
MREQLKHDISAIEREIQVAKESQAKLDKWVVGSIRRDPITDPFVGYTRQILITTTDDLGLIQNEIRLAEKYPDNTTIVHMDQNGNENLACVSYKWIGNGVPPYAPYHPFIKFSLGLLGHLNLTLYS